MKTRFITQTNVLLSCLSAVSKKRVEFKRNIQKKYNSKGRKKIQARASRKIQLIRDALNFVRAFTTAQ